MFIEGGSFPPGAVKRRMRCLDYFLIYYDSDLLFLL